MSDPGDSRSQAGKPLEKVTPRQTGFVRVGLGLVGIALIVAASQTRVFTDGADVVTAIAFVVFAMLTAYRFRVMAANGYSSSSLTVSGRVPARSIIVWTGLAACTLGFELFNFAESRRRAHPTLSSALTVLATHSLSRGVAFLAWLALGAWIAWS